MVTSNKRNVLTERKQDMGEKKEAKISLSGIKQLKVTYW